MGKRNNQISGQFSALLIEMLESPARRVLSLAARRILDRIEIELAHHGGNDNGRLPVTYEDFVEFGIDRHAIAPALRELEELGFIRITEHGRGGNAENRKPNLLELTYAHSRDSRQSAPTHDWRKIKTIKDAKEIAAAARAAKSEIAVAKGQRAAKRRMATIRAILLSPAPDIGQTELATEIDCARAELLRAVS